MKPIKLKIKGLNSFIEEQVIDFEKLCENGLFGIFGPTGSGKSTILDGITLALYGGIARKSNYINTNCKTCGISFEFEISGASKQRYLIEREFRLDKKTGNARAVKSKIIELNNNNILAEGATSLKEKCEEIIGLSLEDFTRTVVLPQGSFNEFLKLSGSSRCNMLERLFNLQKYGNNLNSKLKLNVEKEKSKKDNLVGQLKGYEDVTSENKILKETNLKESVDELNELFTELEDIKKNFEINQEIWNLQNEFKVYESKSKELELQEQSILEKKEKIRLSELAQKVKPFIDSYKRTKREFKENKAKKDFESIRLENILVKRNEISQKFNINKKEFLKLDSLKEQENILIQASKDKKEADNLEVEMTSILVISRELKKNKENLEEKILNYSNNENSLKQDIDDLELKSESFKVDIDFKEKVQMGVSINKEISEIIKREDELKVKIDNLNVNINNNKELVIEFESKLEVKDKELNSKENYLKNIINNCPGNISDLINLQEKFSYAKEKSDKHNKVIEELNILKIDNENLKNEFKINKSLNNDLEKVIFDIKDNIKKVEIENISQKLRQSLEEGKHCPVCGSLEHKTSNLESIKNDNLENLSLLEENLNLKESEKAVVIEKISLLEVKIKFNEEQSLLLENDIKSLDIKSFDIENLGEQLIKLKNDIHKYDKDKNVLEEAIKVLKEDKNSLEQEVIKIKTEISQEEKSRDVYNCDILKNNTLLQDLKSKVEILSNEINVINFENKYKELFKLEKDNQILNEKLKNIRINYEKIRLEKSNFEINLNKINEELAINKTSYYEKQKNKLEKIKLVESNVKNIDTIRDDINVLRDLVSKIEEDFKLSEENKEKIENEYRECNDIYIELNSKDKQLQAQLKSDEENLKISIENENFESSDEVLKNLLEPFVLESLKNDVLKFFEEKSKNKGFIEKTIENLNGRSIDEEAYNFIKKDKLEKELKYDNLKKEVIKLEDNVKLINEKSKEFENLLIEQEKIDYKLNMLLDLDKLFKGKKFIEFIALNKLKYISVEASKRLKEITNNNYGLEVDTNGKFIIRDYKNGGAIREASTLSGGETFIVSLALALALSAQIQLKGTSQLELFFLDEGFGTLDDNLLEVVMNSLERIHNDKLKIGLISHVESIKNRIPTKLVVTPAISGMGGSKVKIEKS